MAAWDIWQCYVTSPDSDVEVRARRSLRLDADTLTDFEPRSAIYNGEETVLCRVTVKTDIPTNEDGGLSRQELESTVEEHFFVQAWALSDGRHLRKFRVEYMVALPVDGHHVITVDTFKDHLEGLVLAEVEFPDWSRSTAFEPPGFLGLEVTHDPRYRNARLAATNEPPHEPEV